MLNDVVYTYLSGDGTLTGLCPLITPSQPTDNTPFPFLYYSITDQEDELVFGEKATGITKYVLRIEVAALTQTLLDSIANRVIVLLSGWVSSPDVAVMKLLDKEQDEERDYYTYIMRFRAIGV